MKHFILGAFVILITIGCSHKPTTAEAKKSIEDKYTPKVGAATKRELVEEYGSPEWCKLEEAGNETCRFYKKRGTKWIGDKETKRDKKNVEQFDQVIADFDSDGVLRKFKADAQR